jgi:hypothetical protein
MLLVLFWSPLVHKIRILARYKQCLVIYDPCRRGIELRLWGAKCLTSCGIRGISSESSNTVCCRSSSVNERKIDFGLRYCRVRSSISRNVARVSVCDWDKGISTVINGD